jgi:hypothetical protein
LHIESVTISPNPAASGEIIKIEVEIYAIYPTTDLYPATDLYPGEDLFAIFPLEALYPDTDLYPTEGGIE